MLKQFPRTLLNTFLYIGVTLAVVIIALSGVLYAMVEQAGLALMQQNNAALLQEAGFHLSYVNQVGVSFCQMQFNDSDVQTLIGNAKVTDPILTGQIIRRMDKFLMTNEMAENVFLYNGRTDRLYSTLSVSLREYNDMYQLLKADTQTQALVVLPRSVYNDVKKTCDHPVLTYVMTEREKDTNRILSAVAVNVSTEWMMANISDARAKETGRMVLLRKNGELLLDSENDMVGEAYTLPQDALETVKNAKESFYWMDGGVRKVVSCRPVEGTDWLLVTIQPYQALAQFAGKIRNRVLLVVFLSFVVGVPFTGGIARVIYKPFNTLLSHVATGEELPGQTGGASDVEYLLNVFDSQQDRLKKLENYRWKNENQARKDSLRAILLDNGTHVLLPVEPGGDTKFQPEEPVLLVLLTIGNLEAAVDSEKEKNLIRYAIANIAEELMQPFGPAEAVTLRGEKVAMLAVPATGELEENQARRCVLQISEKAAQIFGLSVSVVFKPTVFNNQMLRECYLTLEGWSKYTLLYGPRCVLTESDLKEQDQRTPAYPAEQEKAILEALNSTNGNLAADHLRLFFQSIREDSAQGYIDCVIKLTMALQSYVQHVNAHKLVKIQMNFSAVLCQIRAAQTEEQIRSTLTAALQEIAQQMPYSAEQKNDAIIEAVRQSIDAHYMDKDLCGKMLAAKMDISTGYLNLLFKDAMGCSVQEYINRVRLDHAQQLVLQTNQQISQIIEACGLESSSFYRLYRTRFGASPKEQRTRQKLSASEQETV